MTDQTLTPGSIPGASPGASPGSTDGTPEAPTREQPEDFRPEREQAPGALRCAQ